MQVEVSLKDIEVLSARSTYDLAISSIPYLPASSEAHNRSPLEVIKDLYKELEPSLTDETKASLREAEEFLKKNEIDSLSKLSHAIHVTEVTVLALSIGHLVEVLVELIPSLAHGPSTVVKGIALLIIFIVSKKI